LGVLALFPTLQTMRSRHIISPTVGLRSHLHLLDDFYPGRISNRESRRYAPIAAYNGGAGNALRTLTPQSRARECQDQPDESVARVCWAGFPTSLR